MIRWEKKFLSLMVTQFDMRKLIIFMSSNWKECYTIAIFYKRITAHGIKATFLNAETSNWSIWRTILDWISFFVFTLSDKLLIIPNFSYKTFIGWNVIVCSHNLALLRPATKELRKNFRQKSARIKTKRNMPTRKQPGFWLGPENN